MTVRAEDLDPAEPPVQGLAETQSDGRRCLRKTIPWSRSGCLESRMSGGRRGDGQNRGEYEAEGSGHPEGAEDGGRALSPKSLAKERIHCHQTSTNRHLPATFGLVVKRALILLLVVVVVLTGLPVVFGMAGMGVCAECGPAVLVGSTCAAAILAAGVSLLVALLAERLRSRGLALRVLLLGFLLERPPRLA